MTLRFGQKEYCDVVSFNIYEETPSGRTADELATELDFPVVIGEFHFGSLDRGMFDLGLRRAKDQADRAEKYAAYIRQAAVAPWCVGAHWFQYLDQALVGLGLAFYVKWIERYRAQFIACEKLVAIGGRVETVAAEPD